MPMFLRVIVAGAVSLVAGLATSIAATEILPCHSDPAGCGMAAGFSGIGAIAAVVVSMIVFGIALIARRKEPAVNAAAIVLLSVLVVLSLLGPACELIYAGSIDLDRLGNISKLVQMFLPMVVVVVVQWRLLRWQLKPPDRDRKLA
jgi:hypothetical protein